MRYFCECYLRILNQGIKQHKEEVMCLIGEPNSGKTSLFMLITGIIPASYLLFCSCFGLLYQVENINAASEVFSTFERCPLPKRNTKSQVFLDLVQSVEVVYVSVDRYIAMITKQKAFNKSHVDQKTQVIFMDEAHVKLLDPDDWKVLTQGGLTAHDRKFRSSNQQQIRCPMFITCQTEMDFGQQHNAAFDARLCKFYLKV